MRSSWSAPEARVQTLALSLLPPYLRHGDIELFSFWARNFLAWPRFRDAQPNVTHRTIASWERSER